VRTFLIVVASVIGLVVVGFVVAGPSALEVLPAFGKGDDALAVRLGKVAKRELVETVSAPGELDPEVKVDVSAEVSARVRSARGRPSARAR